VVLVAVALPLLALLAYGFTRDAKDIPSPLIGGKAPLFTLPLFESGSISLESLRGKVVFLNFWASWCAPCRAEARTLEAAWLKYRDRDVVFVGVDIQDKEEDAREFLREFGITYPNARDASGQAAIEYGVWGSRKRSSSIATDASPTSTWARWAGPPLLLGSMTPSGAS
jgi:cytochrome c biogenesis protein CcmG/thiol:disulfide interchange protein DsbE